MSALPEKYVNSSLKRVLYYRTQSDANLDLNWDGFHDVGQGVELEFEAGHFFIAWDTTTETENLVMEGRMLDFLNAGVFEDVSGHPNWLPFIGKKLKNLEQQLCEVTLSFNNSAQVFIVSAEVDPENLIIDGMVDNLVVFFSKEKRDAFFAQYEKKETEA